MKINAGTKSCRNKIIENSKIKSMFNHVFQSWFQSLTKYQ